MKNAIFSYFLPAAGVDKLKHYRGLDGIPEWGIRASSYFQKYADIHGVDYHFSTESYCNARSNYFEICRVYLDPMFDQYDKVLFVDLDVVPKDMNTNIFDIDVIDVAGWPEFKHTKIKGDPKWDDNPALRARFEHFGAPMIKPKTATDNSTRMLNTGVLLWSKQARIKAREQFDHFEDWFGYKNKLLEPGKWEDFGHSSYCLDQPFLNAMFNKFNFDVLELDYKWNRFPTKDENEPCYFAHYLGKDGKNVILDVFPEL